jgi:hypothetical protein
MLGFNSMSTQTDEGLWALARAADEAGLRTVLMGASATDMREALANASNGPEWLRRYDQWMQTFGNRISAAHLDVMFPTWKEDPTPVLETINSYFARMDAGWHLHDARDEVMRQRDAGSRPSSSASPRRIWCVPAPAAGRPAGLCLPGRPRLLHRRGLHRRAPQHAHGLRSAAASLRPVGAGRGRVLPDLQRAGEILGDLARDE